MPIFSSYSRNGARAALVTAGDYHLCASTPQLSSCNHGLLLPQLLLHQLFLHAASEELQCLVSNLLSPVNSLKQLLSRHLLGCSAVNDACLCTCSSCGSPSWF